ncbi:MAG: bifunctional aspartate kinase/homoserine dehydrogenase I [Chitinophagaceae bacterium]|nr:bifunctional aspartate kinase/homoserine dehydrogenase I [Bacteroidota bacterium]MCC6257403.1 bifunctional aspartate kinase/homoserine dehydrogenase I [Chitinophagaceae bacterium]MCW5916208.1 bifunctional aspartate kinase/homoserine dehydrogenase I [Ferruginibacter sp.]
MQVLKFGGTSVSSAENMLRVGEIVDLAVLKGRTLVVLSAMSGITDLLLEASQQAASGDFAWSSTFEIIQKRHQDCMNQLFAGNPVPGLAKKLSEDFEELHMLLNGIFLLGELSDKVKDRVAGFGELLSTQIFASWYKTTKNDVVWVDSRDFIITDKNFGKASVVTKKTNQKIIGYFANNKHQVYVFPGFIAKSEDGFPTTLGRGGSDYTAALIGAALDAEVVEIWTDVSGMMTADPRIVKNIKQIPEMSYQEAMELSHFGAKVIHPPTIRPLMKKNIPVWIKNSFQPLAEGTLVHHRQSNPKQVVSGISSINKIVLISLEGSGMIGIPGFSKRLFEALASEKINVVLITQGSSEHSICVGIEEPNMEKAKISVDLAFEYEISQGLLEPLSVERDLSIVAIVGDNMQNHTGVSGRMFSALGRNGVNIRAIAQGASERNISAVINTMDVSKAVNVLHEEFFETSLKQVNLFIAGTGNVGKRLIDQLLQQHEYLKRHLRLNVRIVSLVNSKKILFSNLGISRNWQEELEKGAPFSLTELVNLIREMNLRNSIFVDVTANEEVAGIYPALLERSVAVVACNKVAASSGLNFYKTLKDLSSKFKAPFLFETNVGAGLPIIGTLNDLIRSGDEIHRIEAVLSGTLNFVFNNYDGTRSFADIVKQAQNEGYTEPDPRLDLSGKDVMRKIMILIREAGKEIEMEDILNDTFLPDSANAGSVADFYKAIEKEEPHFKSLYERASKNGHKLKFVASYADGKAKVGLMEIPPAHDFYHLYGKDNIVLFYTNRYPQQPMVIKGAGAGADVTASGVFADIIRASTL